MPETSLKKGRRAARCLLAALLALGTAPAVAEIEVEVTGVEGELHSNVLTYLSVARYRDREDVDADTMERLCNRIDGEVKSALRPLGHYAPEVDASCTARNGDWQVNVLVAPGEPVRVRELKVEVEGAGAADPAFDGIRNQTTLRVGMRLHHGSYEAVKSEMLRIAATNGYLAARMLDSRFQVDPPELTAGIVLRMDTGPRYFFGEITIDQNVVRPALMQRFVRFKAGDPYSGNELLRTQFALDDSLYFSRVDVTPEEPDPESLTVPVTISAEKSRPILSLGAGYGTDTKLRGTASWTDTRVNDRGHRLRFEIKASENTRRIDSRYDIPIGDPALEKFSVELLNEYEDLVGYNTNETTLRPSITRVRDRWQTVSSLSVTRTTTEEADDTFTNNLLVPGFVLASVPKDFLGQALFSRGFWSELIGSHTQLGSGTDFARLHVQLERSFDFAYQWHLLTRVELGTTWVDEFEDLDGIFRFRAGGDRSVRGFAYQSLSPRELVTDDEGVTSLQPTGGQHMFTGSVEVVRDLPLNLAVAGFFDAGNAFNSWGDALEYSAGLGLRYRLPVVSIGLDVAKPLSTGGKVRLHLNITPKL